MEKSSVGNALHINLTVLHKIMLSGSFNITQDTTNNLFSFSTFYLHIILCKCCKKRIQCNVEVTCINIVCVCVCMGGGGYTKRLHVNMVLFGLKNFFFNFLLIRISQEISLMIFFWDAAQCSLVEICRLSGGV
jgi:hypothetical protein